MKCPSCAAASSDGAAECAACGLVFAKWRARAEKEKREGLEAIKILDAPYAPPPAKDGPWMVRAAAAALVVVWVLALGLYFRAHPAKPRAGAQQSLRGNKTGPF